MKNKQSYTVTVGGIGFLGLLALLFIGLKLGKIINWSWIWVLSPLWIPISLVFAGLLAIVIFMLPGYINEKMRIKKFNKK